MKHLIGLVIALLLIATPVFANSDHDTYNTTNNNQTYNQPTANGGQGGAGGAGGNASAIAGAYNYAPSYDMFAPTNINRVDNDNTNIGINGQMQGQEMNNGQKIAPVQKVNIEVEKPYMNAPSTTAPDVIHGSGKLDWRFEMVNFGIPMYNGENIVSIIDNTSNIRAKSLIKTVLNMKKDEMPITYNTRLLIVKKEAQKSYSVSIIGVPAGSGALGTTGVAGSAVVGPSFAGTKANDLFDIYLLKVE